MPTVFSKIKAKTQIYIFGDGKRLLFNAILRGKTDRFQQVLVSNSRLLCGCSKVSGSGCIKIRSISFKNEQLNHIEILKPCLDTHDFHVLSQFINTHSTFSRRHFILSLSFWKRVTNCCQLSCGFSYVLSSNISYPKTIILEHNNCCDDFIDSICKRGKSIYLYFVF